MRKFLHIALLLAVAAAFCSCGPRQIPRDKMVDIFCDMFMADQQVRQVPELSRQTDSMLVYEAVFNKYGYDTDDFLSTLRSELRDPERFSKIAEEASKRLQSEADALDKVIDHLNWLAGYTTEGTIPVDSILGAFAPDTLDGRLRFTMDSSWSGSRYRMKSVRDDSLKRISDSLKFVADSLKAQADSLEVPADSLEEESVYRPLPRILPSARRPLREMKPVMVEEMEEIPEKE